MSWYRAGTITATNGSPAITGAGGTAWVANIQAGDALKGPDEKLYEVQAVSSDTSITLASNYLGATASGAAYAIMPTQGRVRDLAVPVAALITSYGSVLTGAGAGLFPDGAVGTPAVSFAADPDSGFYRVASNTVALATGGAVRTTWSSSGELLVGRTSSSGLGQFQVAGGCDLGTDSGDIILARAGGNVGINFANPGALGKLVVGDTNGTLFFTAPSVGFGELSMVGGPGNFLRIGPFGHASGGTSIMYTNGSAVRIEGARVDGTGNVGIGLTVPTEKLTVAGAIRATSSSAGFNLGPAGAVIDFVAGNSVRIGHVSGAAGSPLPVRTLVGGNETTRHDADGNFLLGATAAGGGATKVLGLGNATPPTTSPAGMGQLYADAGALKWRGSSGTVTTVAPA